jgi:hypothetical protein
MTKTTQPVEDSANADNTADNIADNNEGNTPSQAEIDALMSASEGIQGTLTPNSPETEEKDDNKAPVMEEGESEEGDDDSGDDAGDKGDLSDEQEGDEADRKTVPPEVKEEKDEAGVYKEPTIEDPGEFKPSDYSFEVKTTDGKTHKIASLEDAEALAAELDEKPELISASQFMSLNRKTAQMEIGQSNDKQKHEEAKAKFDDQQSTVKLREDTLDQWNKELIYLAKNGELPEISKEMNEADWTDPEVANDPAVKARLEIAKWMETENTKRLAVGLEPVKSMIDAHSAMQLEAMKKQGQEEVSKEKEQRQKKGGMVGGPSSHQPSNAPAGSIVGAGGSLDDVITEYMNGQ